MEGVSRCPLAPSLGSASFIFGFRWGRDGPGVPGRPQAALEARGTAGFGAIAGGSAIVLRLPFPGRLDHGPSPEPVPVF